MNSSDVLRKHGIGVIAGIKLVSLLGYALQSQGVMDMGVYRYQFLQNRAYNPMKILGERIRSLRERNYSQVKFAETFGIGQSSVVRYEKGEHHRRWICS